MTDDRVALTRQVKEASDIVAVLSSYLTVQHAGSTYKAVCPFHNDTRPSLSIDPRWQNFRCWSCGKKGDVFTFVSEFEKVSFLEAREILARRAGINLQGNPVENVRRGKLLDAVKWADGVYQECLRDSPLGERARLYVGDRKLTGPTVRAFGLGYAPADFGWLVRAARTAGRDLEILQEVGLIGTGKTSGDYYDRFRDRVMFPIRDPRGQTVGFGGRILPDAPSADAGPKYYNSSETPLFLKKELLYGLDIARNAGATEGYLAVVEGYTDVMMAHQHGVTHVVATMGTALNEAHVRQLRRFVPKVVLVFDADAGGVTGVDRALEIFVGCDVELAIATLPEGLDPCDLLVAQGPEPFRRALAGAVDALDFKLNQLLANSGNSVDGIKRVVETILGVMALAPATTGEAGQIKQELLLTRLAQRLGLRQETVWARFGELRAARKKEPTRTPVAAASSSETPAESRSRPARVSEVQLLQLLLADSNLVGTAYEKIRPEDIEHPGLQELLAGLYRLFDLGEPANIDGLREFIDKPRLIEWAMENQEIGSKMADREVWLMKVLGWFQTESKEVKRRVLKARLLAAKTVEEQMRLIRELQDLDRIPDVRDSDQSP